MAETKRIWYFDYLRLIAALAVVVIHVCVDYWTGLSATTLSWNVINVYDSMVRFANPIFFMVSGALFLGGIKSIDIGTVYKKNVLRIAVVFLFWSVLYAVIYAEKTLYGMAEAVALGHYHLWFLPAIIGCYIAAPFLKKIVESKKLMKYFLVLGFLFSVLFPFVTNLMITFPISEINTLGKLFSEFYSSIGFRLAVGNPFYFVLGHYLNTTDISKRIRLLIYAFGVVGFGFTAAATAFASVKAGSTVKAFYEFFSLNSLMEVVAVFVFAKYVLSKLAPKGDRAAGVLSYLSKCTLGVYLIHPLVIDVLARYLHLNAMSVTPIIAVPLVSVAVYCVSMLLSALLNKIPLVNKYIL